MSGETETFCLSFLLMLYQNSQKTYLTINTKQLNAITTFSFDLRDVWLTDLSWTFLHVIALVFPCAEFKVYCKGIKPSSPRNIKVMGFCDTFFCAWQMEAGSQSHLHAISLSQSVCELCVCVTVCVAHLFPLSFQHCEPRVMSWTKKKE